MLEYLLLEYTPKLSYSTFAKHIIAKETRFARLIEKKFKKERQERKKERKKEGNKERRNESKERKKKEESTHNSIFIFYFTFLPYLFMFLDLNKF